MKIGILTFHRAINYGAIIQCYVLYTTLSAMGHNVEVIDYRPHYIEHDRKYYNPTDLKGKNTKEKIRYVISCFLQILSKKRMNKIADDYLKSNIKFSKICTCGHDIPKDYDVIFFGSDQIWNPNICNGFDKIYFGHFDTGNAIKIAYAASLGDADNIKDLSYSRFKELIENYDAISVREETTRSLLTTRFGIRPKLVCDPSLLLSKEHYCSITHPVRDKNYIILFALEKSSAADTFAKRISQQTGRKVIRLYANKNPFTITPFETRKELSPIDFISYIRYASCVITDSFHATVFSIIMHTNFYTLRRKSNNSRSETLLNTFGLSSRMVNASDDIDYSEVNFSDTNKKLDAIRNSSLEYITSSLGSGF